MSKKIVVITGSPRKEGNSTKENKRSMTPLICAGMEYQYTGMENTTASASRMAGAMSLKADEMENGWGSPDPGGPECRGH